MKIEVGDIIYHDEYGIGYVYTNSVLRECVLVSFVNKNENINVLSNNVKRIAKKEKIQCYSTVYNPIFGFGEVEKEVFSSGKLALRVYFKAIDKTHDYDEETNRRLVFDKDTKTWDIIFPCDVIFERFKPDSEADETLKSAIDKLECIIKELSKLMKRKNYE